MLVEERNGLDMLVEGRDRLDKDRICWLRGGIG